MTSIVVKKGRFDDFGERRKSFVVIVFMSVVIWFMRFYINRVNGKGLRTTARLANRFMAI